jgi:hypothetical protein
MNESINALAKLRKVIQSLQREEMIQIQKEHGDALSKIVEIAKENSLTFEHIEFAMNVKPPKAYKSKRTPTKSKKEKVSNTSDHGLTEMSIQ